MSERRQPTASIPDIPEDMEQPLRDILIAIKTTLDQREGRLGANNERLVTVQDLVDKGVIADGDL